MIYCHLSLWKYVVFFSVSESEKLSIVFLNMYCRWRSWGESWDPINEIMCIIGIDLASVSMVFRCVLTVWYLFSGVYWRCGICFPVCTDGVVYVLHFIQLGVECKRTTSPIIRCSNPISSFMRRQYYLCIYVWNAQCIQLVVNIHYYMTSDNVFFRLADVPSNDLYKTL